MMSRKDYVEVAAGLAKVLDTYQGRSEFHDSVRVAVGVVADELADRFSLDNPRFDRDQFLGAALERGVKVGDYGTIGSTRVRVVGFRSKVKGPITETMKSDTRYVVFVEQRGDYRMGTTLVGSWRGERGTEHE